MDLGNILKTAATAVGADGLLAQATSSLGIDATQLATIQTLKAKYDELMADGKLTKEEVLMQVEALAKEQGIDVDNGMIGKAFDMLEAQVKDVPVA
jgi:hypothetical protein